VDGPNLMRGFRKNGGPKNGPILVTILSRGTILGAEKWTHLFLKKQKGGMKNGLDIGSPLGVSPVVETHSLGPSLASEQEEQTHALSSEHAEGASVVENESPICTLRTWRGHAGGCQLCLLLLW
jgi:hypothetical protein